MFKGYLKSEIDIEDLTNLDSEDFNMIKKSMDLMDDFIKFTKKFYEAFDQIQERLELMEYKMDDLINCYGKE